MSTSMRGLTFGTSRTPTRGNDAQKKEAAKTRANEETN